MTKNKKTFDAEFKQDAVNYYYSSGKSLEKAAADLKIGESTLGKWVAAAKNNNGVVHHRGSGNYNSDAKKEIARLKERITRFTGCVRYFKKGYGHTEQLTESIYTATNQVAERRKVSVNSVLKVLGVSSSGYYSWIKHVSSDQEKRKQEIKIKIAQIYNESYQIYGASKITSILQSRGHVISERTVGNYMREEGIQAIWIRPYVKTTIKNILDRDFKPTAPNTV